MTFLIYKISNKINGKCYIGKTNNLETRISQHIAIAKNKKLSYIHKAIKKYGFDNFSVDILMDNIEQEDLAYKVEAEFITQYNSNDNKFGYNISSGGRGVMSNMTHTNDGREKISKAQKGMPARRENYDVSDKTKSKLSVISKENKGKLSLEIKKEILDMYDSCQYTKQQIADKFGIRFEAVRFITIFYKKHGFRTEEEKTANRLEGHKHLRGVPWTDERRSNLSKSLKGHAVSDETRANISKALTGKTIPEDVRDKIAITLTGDPNYAEKRDKIVLLYGRGMKAKQISIELNFDYEFVASVVNRYRKR